MTTDRQARLDWLGLRLIPGVGSVRFSRLLKAFGSPGQALGAPLERLRAVPGLGDAVAQAIHRRAFAQDPEKELTRLDKMGAKVVTVEDPDYPPLLARIYAAPPILFVRGDLGPCGQGGVAVVGSRSMSPYGRRVAEDLGRDLARAGVCVVSGLARGIDTAAHRSALAAGGPTAGVLGCGLDVPYPRENLELVAQMAQKGAVLTEFPLGTPPVAANFPVRNRIISGLSRAVVVVEGGLRSGSLITARHALDQGREVFAVPGPVGTPGVEGCHELIRQGARLFSSSQDILAPGALPALKDPLEQTPVCDIDLPPQARRLLELIGADPVHVDLLARESGLLPQEVSALLVNLELAGLVSAQPGKHYVRN